MRRLLADGWALQPLSDGWELAGSPPDTHAGVEGLDELDWIPAAVPGTVAGALMRRDPDDPRLEQLDALDWWLRTAVQLTAGETDGRLLLWLDGLATFAEVYLDGDRVLESESMFEPHAVAIKRAPGGHELVIGLRALTPRLQGRRTPRARWRTRIVPEANLRFVRTMLLGRAPGLAAGPPVVGPFRPVALQHRRVADVCALRLRATAADRTGVVAVDGELAPIAPASSIAAATLVLTDPDGACIEAELALEPAGDGTRVHGRIVVAEPQRWWPHTHGTPALYDVRLRIATGDGGELTVSAGRIGFRELTLDRELERDGLALSCNGVRLFVRGAVWTPLDLIESSDEDRVRATLEHLVEAGMNMVRVPGIACYESRRFYDLCDELGILVWQDFMFANFDYPDADPGFMATVQHEVETLLDELGHRPSLAVLCGGSEVAQQAAMLGLDPALADGPLYGQLLPRLIAQADLTAPYVPSTPWGGTLPFRPDHGVANYYGVGAYRRPLEDARRADVRFCGECLALANIPDDDALAGLVVGGAAWKRGVQRDQGAGWDFDDVRDFYLRLLYGVDPVATRTDDPERYLELSRQLSGEVMAETFGEWRRHGSPCSGALVLWLSDLRPGAGWGLLDHRGRPKAALHELRRVLAPVAVWTVDEGLGGIDVHVANDRPEPLEATVRVALYRDRELLVDEAETELTVAPHGARTIGVEELLGRFVDAAWAYRFGPPAQDLIVASLEQREVTGTRLLSQAFRHPSGRPAERAGAGVLGLEASRVADDPERPVLRVASRRLAHAVRIDAPGYVPADDGFSIEPGHAREIELRPTGTADGRRGRITALNLSGSAPIATVRS